MSWMRPIRDTYRTEGVFSRETCEVTGYFSDEVARAKVLWTLRGGWETKLRLEVEKVLQKDPCLDQKIAALIIDIVETYDINRYPIGFETQT